MNPTALLGAYFQRGHGTGCFQLAGSLSGTHDFQGWCVGGKDGPRGRFAAWVWKEHIFFSSYNPLVRTCFTASLKCKSLEREELDISEHEQSLTHTYSILHSYASRQIKMPNLCTKTVASDSWWLRTFKFAVWLLICSLFWICQESFLL